MESVVELSSLRHIHLQHLHCQLLVLHPYKHLPRGDVPHGGYGHPQTPHHLRHHRLAPGQACHNCQAGHVRGKGAGRGQLDRDGLVGWCDLCGSRWRTGTGPSWSFRYCSQDASRGQCCQTSLLAMFLDFHSLQPHSDWGKGLKTLT